MRAAKVYVISGASAVKVGYSINPNSRLRALSHEVGEKLVLEYESAPIDCAFAVEQAALHGLRKWVVTGEWFSVSAEQAIDEIEQALKYFDRFVLYTEMPTSKQVWDWVCDRKACPVPYATLVHRLRSVPPGKWPERWRLNRVKL